jgi:uncharacterized protein
MLILLSPAKRLDLESVIPNDLITSIPYFQIEALEIVDILRNYCPLSLSKLMSISKQLGELNYQRFQNFNSNPSRAAIYTYKGDVYQELELDKYDNQTMNFINNHVNIISGLYGLLKPLDLIQPYRLEMSTKLANHYGNNLYQYWSKKITNKLNESSDIIINLASEEYSSVISKELKAKMINITFKEIYQQGYRIVGINAKRARGQMLNYLIHGFIHNPNEIKNFSLNNYKFMPNLSTEKEYVFVR